MFLRVCVCSWVHDWVKGRETEIVNHRLSKRSNNESLASSHGYENKNTHTQRYARALTEHLSFIPFGIILLFLCHNRQNLLFMIYDNTNQASASLRVLISFPFSLLAWETASCRLQHADKKYLRCPQISTFFLHLTESSPFSKNFKKQSLKHSGLVRPECHLYSSL